MSLHYQAKDIAPKIVYELDMFAYCYRRIEQEWPTADRGLKNLLLENFLLHARVLRGFLVDTPHQDDVSARHFFDDPDTWTTVSVGLCPYLVHHRDRLNKYVAHLTYSRLDEDKNWDPNIVCAEVMLAWRRFFSMLPIERQGWFQSTTPSDPG
jgi:hypothetical protein